MGPSSTGIALVRRPGPRLSEGIVTHIERSPIDWALAQHQWAEYVETLERCGWDTLEVPPADDCPDAVFVEDAVIVYRGVAVVTRPGAATRRGETEAVAATVGDLGLPLRWIRDPATVDGGDILKIGGVMYVGRGGRTNADGLRQLRTIFRPLGVTIRPVPVRSVLHLKSAVTALPDGTVVGYPPLVDHPSLFAPFLPVAEESGAHVVVLGPGHVLMAADAPRSTDLFRDLGYEVTTVDISEFQKLEGCVTCLSVRIRRRPH